MGMFTLAGMANHFAKIAARFDVGMHGGLKRAAVLVETEAKSAMGTYKYGWPALDPKTVARKRSGDTPLVETGALRDSITHEVNFLSARVYSDDPKMGYHELGTVKMPPRPVLATAAQRKEREVAEILGRQAVSLISGDGGSATIAPGIR